MTGFDFQNHHWFVKRQSVNYDSCLRPKRLFPPTASRIGYTVTHTQMKDSWHWSILYIIILNTHSWKIKIFPLFVISRFLDFKSVHLLICRSRLPYSVNDMRVLWIIEYSFSSPTKNTLMIYRIATCLHFNTF